MTGAEIVGAPGIGAGTGRPGARPVRKSKPQASQNWPDRPVPQLGHGSAGWPVPPDVVAAGVGAAPPIRRPQVSQ
jgi:hypothetical protein